MLSGLPFCEFSTVSVCPKKAITPDLFAEFIILITVKSAENEIKNSAEDSLGGDCYAILGHILSG